MRKIIIAITLGVAAATSLAFTSVGAGTGIGGHASGVGQSDDGLTQVKASATYTGVLNGNGLLAVGACDAEGIGAAASTAIEECYFVVEGREIPVINQPVALPGNVVATPGTAQVDAIPTKMCVVAEARPVVGQPATKTVCAFGAVGVQPPHLVK